jgi:hypothetical protein
MGSCWAARHGARAACCARGVASTAVERVGGVSQPEWGATEIGPVCGPARGSLATGAMSDLPGRLFEAREEHWQPDSRSILDEGSIP